MSYYIDTGGDKDALILIHGLGSHKGSWTKQYPLSEHNRLIVPDLIGHTNNNIQCDITLKNMAQYIINLLDELNIESANFAGLSLGGIVVQNILKSHPNRVKSVILSNTCSYLPYWIGKYAVEQRCKDLHSMTLEEYEMKTVENCLYDDSNKELNKTIHKMFMSVNKDTYLEAAKSPLGINYLPMLMNNDKPKLIIGSVHDKVTPYFNAVTTYLFSRNAYLKTFYKAGHIPNIECADEWNQSVLEFLRRVV